MIFDERSATIVGVKFRMATTDDSHLPTYDNTKLTAYNTCPTWGTIRYGLHKTMQGSGRSLALECGSAMHEVFAFVRFMQLLHHLEESGRVDVAKGVFARHMPRLFGDDRWALIQQSMGDTTEVSLQTIRGCVSVLETSDFYDEPRDKRRTLSNMEEAAIAYVNRVKWDERVWMRDYDDPNSDIGIEIPFDVVVNTQYKLEITGDYGSETDFDYVIDKERPDVEVTHGPRPGYDYMYCSVSRRFTGKIDGIHYNTNNEIVLDENKTASRLNDAWVQSFTVNSQPTGYLIAVSTFTNSNVRKADIHGISIPMPKTYDYGGIVREPITRTDHHFASWIKWFNVTAFGIESDLANPMGALRYTHSCNRYFRPCAFIPLCDSDENEQQKILSEMVHDEWSPLKEEVGE